MITYLSSYGPLLLIALGLSFVMTLAVRGVARRLGVVDHPDDYRKVQERPIPRLGGIAIFVSYFGALLIVAGLYRSGDLGGLFWSSPGGVRYFWVGSGGVAVLAIGVWDDVRGLRARWKFLLLAGVSVLMFSVGFRVEGISNPFGGGHIDLGLWGVPLTLFWFLGCINAMNLIDGLDGLASGVGLFVAATVFVTAVMLGNMWMAFLSIALVGSLLGFLVFNFHPASIFLGDSGSLLLGFLIAALGLEGAQKSRVAVALLIPVIALGLPVMDTMLAILRRWARATPLSAGDRQHIHHKLLDLGFTHRQAVLVLYGTCFVLAICALLMTAVRSMAAAWVLAFLGVLLFFAIHLVGRSEIRLAKRRLGSVIMGMRRGGETRVAGYMAIERMARAGNLDAMWMVFEDAAEAMALERVALTLEHVDASTGDEGAVDFEWRREGSSAEKSATAIHWTATIPLYCAGRALGELHVVKMTDGAPMAPELPETLEAVSEALARNAWRLTAHVDGVPDGDAGSGEVENG